MKPRIFKAGLWWFVQAELSGYADTGPYLTVQATWPEACELLRALYRRKRISRVVPVGVANRAVTAQELRGI